MQAMESSIYLRCVLLTSARSRLAVRKGATASAQRMPGLCKHCQQVSQ